MNEPSKRQIALKSTNDEGTSSMNMSNHELDDLVLLVKKWRGFRNNHRFQKKEEKDEEKTKKIVFYDCDKPSQKRTECPNKKKIIKKKKHSKQHGMIVMMKTLKKMKIKRKFPARASWPLKMR
ncbi:Uncharacterized protein Adt_21561 [Abeliophyllum distichum]|uniref:Uncharacterized protein n=1 Tax=Abeliophyllum distichum TaxID=126358 RepID=A0ABD1SZW0_9LAMI